MSFLFPSQNPLEFPAIHLSHISFQDQSLSHMDTNSSEQCQMNEKVALKLPKGDSITNPKDRCLSFTEMHGRKAL